jgi:hypothetical protein
MIRVSREQLAERWALTYAQDGYQVRATGVPGLDAAPSVGEFSPDIEATKEAEKVVVRIVASPESFEGETLKRELESLEKSRTAGQKLHLIVAAECAHDIKERLDAWHVHADQVHIT